MKIGNYTIQVGRSKVTALDGEDEVLSASKKEVRQLLAVVEAEDAYEKAEAAADEADSKLSSLPRPDFGEELSFDSDGVQIGCTRVTKAQLKTMLK